MNFKKFLLSFSLCLILLTGCVFATTMTQNEIVSDFNSDITELSPDIFDNSDFDMSVIDQINISLSDYDLELSDINNYIYFVLYNENNVSRDLYFYDLGNSTIDSYTYSASGFTFNTTGNINVYTSYVYSDDTDINNLTKTQVSNIFVPIVEQQFTGLSFNSVFTISGNNIFTESGGGDDSGIFAGILATMTFVLGSITTVMNSLIQIDLILFVILASLTITIIYFVVKLLKGFTGNKLLSGKKKRK